MSKKAKLRDKAIKKTITIFSRHEKFIRESFLNLSRFVQEKLDEEIDRREAKK